jgi:predicted nucleic acid-binding protein
MIEPGRPWTVYLDSNPIAYAVEGTPELASTIKQLFFVLRQRPGSAITSELTLAEVLPKRRVPDRDFLELLIWSGTFDLRPVTRSILTETAEYRRAASSIQPDGRVAMPKLPDAIHVVTAIHGRCDYFVSSDTRIRLPEGIKLVSANALSLASLIRELQ